MERCRFHTAVQVYKAFHDLCPQYLRNWFIYAEAHTGHIVVEISTVCLYHKLAHLLGKIVFSIVEL